MLGRSDPRASTPAGRATLPGRPGIPGRHRTAGSLPDPVGLIALVVVLLGTFGAGVALLSPSFANGAGTSPPRAETAAGVAVAGDPAGSAGVRRLGGPVIGGAPAATPTAKPRPKSTGAPSRTVKPPPATGGGDTTTREDRVTVLVNQERATAGCGPVRNDERLRRAARGHSRDMAERDYFSHDSLDGRSPWGRAEAAGYTRAIGENIAKGQRTPQDVVASWMDSPGHRRNILNCDAKAIGVGLAYDGDAAVWTQLFGSA